MANVSTVGQDKTPSPWGTYDQGGNVVEMLDTLAAAYAEAGRFPEAVRASRKAVDLASSRGQPELAKQMESRMRLYQAGQPYHESAGS